MLLLLAGIQFGLFAAPPPPPDAGAWKSRLAAAIRQAVSANPDLSAMEARIEASRQRVLQSDAFPDPEVEVGIRDLPVSSPSLTRDDFTMEMVGARQSLPGVGKRAARRASAEAASNNALALHEVHAAEIAADVADVFFTIADLDRRLEILERSRERLKTTSASASERYRVGKGSQSDVLRANLQTTALEERFIALKSERRVLSARFNSLQKLSGHSAGFADRTPRSLASDSGSAIDSTPGRRAQRRTPRGARKRPQSRGGDAARGARTKAGLDALHLLRPARAVRGHGGRLRLDQPSVRPPAAPRREARGDGSGAVIRRADLEAVRNQISRDIEAAAAELERNVEQEKLYRTSILPQAEVTFRAARESYAVGQIDFETYVRAALDLDNYESEHAARAAGIGRALAALQKASGLPLIEGTPTAGGRHVEE